MSAWNHAICERCWILANSEVDDEGKVLSIRRPSLLREPQLETCCFCGMSTIFGGYVRSQPMSTCRHRAEVDA